MNISYPLRNVSFSENFAYVLNEWSLYFAANFQPTANVTKISIFYVASILNTPLVKLSVYTFNMFTSFVS